MQEIYTTKLAIVPASRPLVIYAVTTIGKVRYKPRIVGNGVVKYFAVDQSGIGMMAIAAPIPILVGFLKFSHLHPPYDFIDRARGTMTTTMTCSVMYQRNTFERKLDSSKAARRTVIAPKRAPVRHPANEPTEKQRISFTDPNVSCFQLFQLQLFVIKY